MPTRLEGQIEDRPPTDEIILPGDFYSVNLRRLNGLFTIMLFECDVTDARTNIFICEEADEPVDTEEQCQQFMTYENFRYELGNEQHVQFDFTGETSADLRGYLVTRHFVTLGRIAI